MQALHQDQIERYLGELRQPFTEDQKKRLLVVRDYCTLLLQFLPRNPYNNQPDPWQEYIDVALFYLRVSQSSAEIEPALEAVADVIRSVSAETEEPKQ